MESYATAAQVWAAGLIFARIGALLMVIPGVGEQSVPPRIRLAFALLFTLMLYPVLVGSMPAVPASVGSLAAQVIKEILIGLVIGTILRLFMASLATAGEVVSLQTTLSFAQTANPGQAQPTATLATFLALLGLVLVMTTDLHHMFISAVVRSYTLFPVVKPLPVGDSAQLAIQTVGDSFALGIQLSAPVLVFSLVFNIATGLVGRVMPQFPVFFVASPIMVLLGLSIFALSLGAVGLVWVDRYRQLADVFV
ncbi:flagellar biosynthetic protein FliR [Phenylobacterium sp.]|jgi:flagellar biosynthetic protein FliR|uniref:flagellar biosynthetic protein FliR n=1 Tax=Phenylobacterium sp. TaxID=1871053 RepID=UPI002E33B89F|nr:flagellar biosynthetic protein FliR [Phenylobacterium sp.]HEX2559112.1 flagellar biosynthetic protein FliR [Phenylobacterium sp.]